MLKVLVKQKNRAILNSFRNGLVPRCTTQLSQRQLSAGDNLVEVFVDDQSVKVEPGTSVLEACARVGVEIPRFCYHERLSIAGNCRMCLVEVEKSVKPVASCAMPVMPGMKIKPNSEFSRKAREGVMEFLLLNHPLDCPICDQGGECDLQDQSMAYGSDRSRLRIGMDQKRAVEDKNIGPIVRTIMTRCIQCTRCVRFMNEIGGCADLGTSGRGTDMQIGTYLENTTMLSELSGNIVDICPVGALTSTPYTFNARPWELRRYDSVDVMDAVGSNISVCQRSGDLMRIIPRAHEDINEEWLADKSRHAPIDGLKTQRLTVPMLRPSSTSQLQECDWEDALISLSQAINAEPSRVVAMVGPHTDAETMVAAKDFMNSLGSDSLYVHVDPKFDESIFPKSSNLDFRQNYLFNTGIGQLEEADFVLIVGSNPRFEAPLVNARLRKAWRNSTLNDIVLIGPKDLDLLYDYTWAGDDVNALSQIYYGNHPVTEKLKAAKKPVIILGQQILKTSLPSNAYDLSKAVASKYNAEFNVLHSNASQVAALDLSFKPSFELDFADNGKPSVFWLFGVDDKDLKIPSNCFVVYQGHTGEIGANQADLVIPGAAFTEKQGTYVNMEGRAQQTLAAITPPSLARVDWQIVRAVSEISNRTLPYDTLVQLRNRMGQITPSLVQYNKNVKPGTVKSSTRASVSKVSNTKLTPLMKNLADYYQTDIISRSSATMAKCVQAVNKELGKRQTNSTKKDEKVAQNA